MHLLSIGSTDLTPRVDDIQAHERAIARERREQERLAQLERQRLNMEQENIILKNKSLVRAFMPKQAMVRELPTLDPSTNPEICEP